MLDRHVPQWNPAAFSVRRLSSAHSGQPVPDSPKRLFGVASQQQDGWWRVQRQCTFLLLWGSRSSGLTVLRSKSHCCWTMSGRTAVRDVQKHGFWPAQMGQPLDFLALSDTTACQMWSCPHCPFLQTHQAL